MFMFIIVSLILIIILIRIHCHSKQMLPALQVSHPKVPKHGCQVGTTAAQFTNPQGFLKRATWWAWLGALHARKIASPSISTYMFAILFGILH